MSPLVILTIGIAIVLFCIIVLRLHAVLSLLLAATVTGMLTPTVFIYDFAINQGMEETAATTIANLPIGKRLANAFGNTAGKIGVLIAMASIIGSCLMHSGGAERIIRSLLRIFGKRNPSLAFLSGSFTLAIPIFFDTVFYLMIPLVKSVGIKIPKQYGVSLMAVTAGSAMAHSLIPPTPGPLFAAQELGVDLGAMIIWGILVGLLTIISGYAYAIWINRRYDLPVRNTPDIDIEALKALSEKPKSDLPGLGFAIIPVFLPLILIAGNTITHTFIQTENSNQIYQGLRVFFNTFGDSNIALIVSAFIAMLLLWSREKNFEHFSTIISKSLTSGAIIILITASGGVFGNMLQQTGIGIQIEEMATHYQLAVLPLAFLITAVMRIAQGSATVAMITAIGILSGLADAATLGFHPVYLALVIGCGSKVFPWMNDSGFWIISQMSGMEKHETFRFFSILLAVMGFAGLIVIMFLARVFPYV